MRVSLLLSICAAICAVPLAAAELRPDVAGTIDRVIGEHKVPAMSVVRIRNGVIEPEVVRGVRKIGAPDRVRTGERWHLGSDTKAMTATLIGRLVDNGKLKWTDRIDTLLPDLVTQIRPEYRSVTLLDLLSHTAGLPDRLSDETWFMARFDDHRPLTEQRLEYIQKGLGDPPVAPPRTKNLYSNTGYIIAGVIAERVGGKPYEQLMKEMVFVPLGMTSATFERREDAELSGHDGVRPATGPHDGNPSVFSAAGEARMAMGDWARFALDQLQGAKGEGKLLKPQTYRVIQSHHGGKSDHGWGLGWDIKPRGLGRSGPTLTHVGSDGNWIVVAYLYPETTSGILMAANAGWTTGTPRVFTPVGRALTADLAPPALEPPKAATAPGK